MASNRPSARDRGYTTAWEKASAAFLKAHPWCAYCAERRVVTKATLVDHIVPHRGDKDLFWKRSNWASCCAACHDGAKKAAERGGTIMRGCDENGNPLDQRHHWRSNGEH